MPGTLGLAVKQSGNWYIIYKDNIITELARVVVAHELGHILLGHNLITPAYYSTFRPKGNEEREAESFALRLLAPSCVLGALDLHTADEIASACQIPIEQASQRAERMKHLYDCEISFSSPLERAVHNNFTNFIKSTCTKRWGMI